MRIRFSLGIWKMAAGKVDPKVRIYKICVQFQGSSTLLDLLVKTKKQNQYHSLSKSSWFSLLPALLFLTLPLLTAFHPSLLPGAVFKAFDMLIRALPQ